MFVLVCSSHCSVKCLNPDLSTCPFIKSLVHKNYTEMMHYDSKFKYYSKKTPNQNFTRKFLAQFWCLHKMTSKFIYYLNRERTEYKLGLAAKLQLIGTSSNLSKQCKLNKPPTHSALSCLLSQRTVEDVYFNLKNTKSK